MSLTLTIRGSGLPRFEEAVEALGSREKAQRAYRRSLNEAGRDTTAPTYRALASQTGLKIMTAKRALRPQKATMSSLEFKLEGRGGDIGLRHFGARETRPGVSAAPFGKRQVFASTFIKGGLFPNRKALAFGGTVFEPTSVGGWGRPFAKAKSGVRIPVEMVKGITSSTFNRISLIKLNDKVARHLRLITKGVLS